METIALFGGSFDPPHIGHEAVVGALLKLDYIDKIVVMPTFLNPFKTEFHAPADLRLQWLKTIFLQKKNVIVDDYEVNLQRRVPTIETVEYLLRMYKKIYVVIGADNLSSLPLWERYDELKEKVTFIIATRDDIAIPKSFIRLNIDENISSSDLRKTVNKTKLTNKSADIIAQYYKEKNAK